MYKKEGTMSSDNLNVPHMRSSRLIQDFNRYYAQNPDRMVQLFNIQDQKPCTSDRLSPRKGVLTQDFFNKNIEKIIYLIHNNTIDFIELEHDAQYIKMKGKELNRERQELIKSKENIEKYEKELKEDSEKNKKDIEELGDSISIISKEISKKEREIKEHKDNETSFKEKNGEGEYYSQLYNLEKQNTELKQSKSEKLSQQGRLIEIDMDIMYKEVDLEQIRDDYEEDYIRWNEKLEILNPMILRSKENCEHRLQEERKFQAVIEGMKKTLGIPQTLNLLIDIKQKVALTFSILNDYQPEIRENEDNKELPQTLEDRNEETKKIISQANEIGLYWISIGYKGPKNIGDAKELYKYLLRDAAWKYGLKSQDSNQEKLLKNLIYESLDAKIEYSEIKRLVSYWRALGAYQVKDKEKLPQQIMKDERTEQQKKELYKQNLRRSSLSFGNCRKDFEKTNAQVIGSSGKIQYYAELNDIIRSSDKLQHHMEEIESFILSEIERVTGQSSKFIFIDQPIGKECKAVVPDSDDGTEHKKHSLVQKLKDKINLSLS